MILKVPFKYFLAVTNVYSSRDKSVQLLFIFAITAGLFDSDSSSWQKNRYVGHDSFRKQLHIKSMKLSKTEFTNILTMKNTDDCIDLSIIVTG